MATRAKGGGELALLQLSGDLLRAADRKAAATVDQSLRGFAESVQTAINQLTMEIRVLNRRLELLEERRPVRRTIERDRDGNILGSVEE